MSTIEFNQLLIHNTDMLKPQAFSFTRDTEEAKDLLNETIYRALANKDKYNEGTNIQAWLYTIMRNTFINKYRRKVRERKIFQSNNREVPQEYNQAITSNLSESRLVMKELQAAIHELPDIFRVPFVLHVEGYQYQEIADHLGIALGTIKSRIHFARKLLKEKLAGQPSSLMKALV
jgi:RNA polymerase sigma factor (sigma-70 family)